MFIPRKEIVQVAKLQIPPVDMTISISPEQYIKLNAFKNFLENFVRRILNQLHLSEFIIKNGCLKAARKSPSVKIYSHCVMKIANFLLVIRVL